MNRNQSPRSMLQSAGRRKSIQRGGVITIVITLLGLCCLLMLTAGAAYAYLQPAEQFGPVVYFQSPQPGQRIDLGQTINVHAIARDESKVTRVELWVDNVLLDVQSSTLAGGISPFPLWKTWIPMTSGVHTLTVRAFNNQKEHSQAKITIEVLLRPDQDGDGTPDVFDACPDQAGAAIAGGCPDMDGDGIPDDSDACPEQAGLPDNDGCPVPSVSDRDGDGMVDSADACPDEPGSPLAGGCRDADGDGTPDGSDACPGEPGPPESGGCPLADGDSLPDDSGVVPGDIDAAFDDDGDGVPDVSDLCPDVPGVARNAGCPETGASDRDGDGVSDDVDLCPDEPGLAEHAGCPPPGAGEDADGDGIPDDEEAEEDALADWDVEPILPEDEVLTISLEFQMLEFDLTRSFDTLSCYAYISNVYMGRFGPYELDGATHWNLAETSPAESSLTLFVDPDEPLEVYANCGGGIEGDTDWGLFQNLGTIEQFHPLSDWDGHVIRSAPESSPSEETFQASYRICFPSCENTDIPAPIASLFDIGGNRRLIWLWNGDRDMLGGYHIYLNGSHILSTTGNFSSLSINDFAPLCGEQYTFQVSAFTTDGRTSALSNRTYWTAPACQRTIQIVFDSLDVHNPPADEDTLHRPGPIFGEFSASAGSSQASLSYDACWCYVGPLATLFGTCDGLKLQYGVYRIQEDIFDWINTQIASCLGAGCHSNSFHAPGSNIITLETDPGADLTIYGKVMDCDERLNPCDVVFEEQETLTIDTSGPLPPPIRWILPGEHINLNVIITVLGGEP